MKIIEKQSMLSIYHMGVRRERVARDYNRSKDGLSALCCAVNQCVIILNGPTAPFLLVNGGKPAPADARPGCRCSQS